MIQWENPAPVSPETTKIRMEGLRQAFMRAARSRHGVAGTWEGPGEDQPAVLEFAVELEDGQTFHIQIQEGSCPVTEEYR